MYRSPPTSTCKHLNKHFVFQNVYFSNTVAMNFEIPGNYVQLEVYFMDTKQQFNTFQKSLFSKMNF